MFYSQDDLGPDPMEYNLKIKIHTHLLEPILKVFQKFPKFENEKTILK